MLRRTLHRAALAVTALAVASAGAAAPALAATASETVSAGSLAFINSTPANVAFPGTTLNGSDQTRTQPQPFDVGDASGSQSGWSISATSTVFSAAGHDFLPGATTIQGAPTASCDASSTCVLPTNSVSYPWTLPAGATAPTASKMYNAAALTGMGNATITPTWTLAVPAATWAGGVGTPYTATWTFTLVSGP